MFSFGSRKKVAPRYLLEENMLTIQQVEKSLPPTLKSAATQQLVDHTAVVEEYQIEQKAQGGS